MLSSHRICTFSLGALLLTGAVANARADAWDKKTYVTISQSIEVPGAVLPAGKYVFKLADSPSDRHIVQILNDRENHVYATNLAIPIERTTPPDKTLITFYEVPGGAPPPVRAWFYPGQTSGQEFVWPANRARDIAQVVKQDVPVLGQRQPASPAAASAAPPELAPAPVNTAPAQVSDAPPPPAAQEAPQIAQLEAPQQPQPEPSSASANPPADQPRSTLPQTAGNTVFYGLLGLCCLGIAALLRTAERWGQ
jgi:hypothetical protein